MVAGGGARRPQRQRLAAARPTSCRRYYLATAARMACGRCGPVLLLCCIHLLLLRGAGWDGRNGKYVRRRHDALSFRGHSRDKPRDGDGDTAVNLTFYSSDRSSECGEVAKDVIGSCMIIITTMTLYVCHATRSRTHARTHTVLWAARDTVGG